MWRRRGPIKFKAGCLLLCLLVVPACERAASPDAAPEPASVKPQAYDPVARAIASRGQLDNPEATVPPQCYTATEGRFNPCWSCHTTTNGRNRANDLNLQARYAFSDVAMQNHWNNLFVDRGDAIAAVDDASILQWVRADNYSPLRAALAGRDDFLGWKPELDLMRGFGDEGFALDGSGWRAFVYQPFPGTFWPTNGSASDAFIRLPPAFRHDQKGKVSAEIYRLNLAILEAAMTVSDTTPDNEIERAVEAVDERLIGLDLNADGELGMATRLHGLPPHFAGAAAEVPVRRWLYPLGTEFLHTLRYLDPGAPSFRARRVKEVRHAVKVAMLEDPGLREVYQEEAVEKALGSPPHFRGTPDTGLLNDFGWMYQAYIEDAQGRLRLQTQQEQRFCMGCHSNLGVTVDGSFSFVRKPPGAAGWGHQSLAELRDRPQVGQSHGEIETWLARSGAADEFRANQEMLARYFPNGELDTEALRAVRDLGELLLPSAGRALALDKAYLAIVREQSFEHGRDAFVSPPENVHRRIEEPETGLVDAGRVYDDGRLWLDWESEAEPAFAVRFAPPPG
ncbi:MAG: hypothetical protein K0U79_15415 [Gammaproteobacteria bacterium]|nr:hypothetical protein [Gammaproteobacteria bacterium]